MKILTAFILVWNYSCLQTKSKKYRRFVAWKKKLELKWVILSLVPFLKSISPIKFIKAQFWPKKLNKTAWIQYHHFHLQWKFKFLAGKFTWCNTAKHCSVMTTNFLFSKVCWQCPAMFCVYSLYLKQTFPPIIWIFTDGSDGIESRLPFTIFSTLSWNNFHSYFEILKKCFACALW